MKDMNPWTSYAFLILFYTFPELSIFPSPGQTFICLAGEREERSSWKGSRGQRFGHDEEMKSRKPNLWPYRSFLHSPLSFSILLLCLRQQKVREERWDVKEIVKGS